MAFELVSVESGAISHVGYYDSTGTLVVKFGDSRYYYKGVPRSIYEQFLVAPSKQTFFRQNILDRYIFSRHYGKPRNSRRSAN